MKKTKKEVDDTIVHALTNSTIIEYLTLTSEEDIYQDEDISNMLVYASANSISLEEASKQLEETPHANTVRNKLDENVLLEIYALEDSLNNMLASNRPPGLTKKKQKVAMDLTFLAYHGKPEKDSNEICRSKAKSGTTHFHCYASAYVIKKNKRCTLAVTYVHAQDSLTEVLGRLFERLQTLSIQLRCLYLDKQFYTVSVIRHLLKLDIPFEIPMVHRGRSGGSRRLLHGRKSYKTQYTMKSQDEGEVTFNVWIVVKYAKGKYGRHGIEYFAYAVNRPACRLHQVYEDYRLRFGIESSYRLMNMSRARTTSRKAALRLLFVGIAFLLVNIWVTIKWKYLSYPRRGGRDVQHDLFPIHRMLFFLAEAVRKIYGAATSVSL